MIDPLPILDKAAGSTDRWLFLATLTTAAGAAAWLFRWLVGRYATIAGELGRVIERNTAALREVSQTIKHCPNKRDT